MLGVVGAPLVPQAVEARKAMVAGRGVGGGRSPGPGGVKARYIVEQYVAAAGGEARWAPRRACTRWGRCG